MDGLVVQAIVGGVFQLIQLGLSQKDVDDKVQGWVDAGMSGEQIRDAMAALVEERKAQAEEAIKAAQAQEQAAP